MTMTHMKHYAVALLLGLALSGRAAAEVDSPALFQQSYDDEAAGKIGEALATLERIPQPWHDSYVAQLRRGWLLYRLGKHADAIESYTRAAALSPKAVEPRVGMLLPLMAERRWVGAQQTAREALQLDPNNYLAALRLAYASYNLGQYAAALGLYHKLHELYPSDTEVLSGVGWTLLKMGKGAEAAAQFREVLDIAPRHALAREGLKAAGATR